MKRLTKEMTIDLNIKGCDLAEIAVKVDYSLYNDGIGAYEFWGAKCFDSGTLCAEIDNILPVFENESEIDKDSINRYINAHFDEIAEKLQEKIEEDGRE